MLPPAAAEKLNEWGHDAISVAGTKMAGATDDHVYSEALKQDRAVVTENFSDFAAIVALRTANGESCVPVVLVRKTDYSRKGTLGHDLARRLYQWAVQNPNPYPGLHWP